MHERPSMGTKSWWARYRRWIFLLAIAYVILMLIVIFLPLGPEKPFVYQIF